jgi:glycosyltransferase involved in cell wall biosynthesis
MKILLVHQNFPGQFRHVAPALVARGHEVAVITDGKNKANITHLSGRYSYDPPDRKTVADAGAPLAGHYAQVAGRGQAAARVAAKMRDQRGFTPDLIFAHPGWGEAMFLKAVWPEARVLHYAEFFYAPTGLDADFDPEFQRATLPRALNSIAMRSHIAQSMAEGDASLAPTNWQASTFPPTLRDRIEVIHDGVDTRALKPDAKATFRPKGADLVLTAGDEVLTYVARNIEPYRGAHIFLRALPEVLRARPEAQVVIVGGDGVSYGATPADGKTWKEVLLKEVGHKLDLSRVHFVGWLRYPDFCHLMQVSRVHVYLTYPFVLSWSLLEAMSMGAAVVASRTPPVMEVIEDGVNGRLVDFFDIPGWSRALTAALADPAALKPLRKAARAHVQANYDLGTCLPRILDLVERTAKG